MDSVVKDGDAKDPKDFAQNTMEIAVPPDNPGKVTQLSVRAGDKVAKGQPLFQIRNYTQRAEVESAKAAISTLSKCPLPELSTFIRICKVG